MTDVPPSEPPDQPPFGTPPPPAPPAPPPPPPQPQPPQYPAPYPQPYGQQFGYPQASVSPKDRVRMAWQRRYETDYIFDFWSAFGWTVLTCGIYGYYVLYQLVRRSREHIQRRIELLDGATLFAWQQAEARDLQEELRPGFERIAANMATLRRQTTEFRDPAIWLVLDIVSGGYARFVAYCLLDGDLVTHDYAEGAIEADLAAIYNRLGANLVAPNPNRLKGKHNYVGRVIATIFTCTIYGLWWLYDMMVEGNRHFEENWVWEDGLAQAVQSLEPAA